ncbi:MAG: C40 family peptidase [Desulfovibrio sp.]|nr:C40 family peptidase [Desulfovibrio sp.]
MSTKDNALSRVFLLAFLLLLTTNLTGCGFFFSSDPDPAPYTTNKILKTAYSQIGKSYKAGGASPKSGFDCSGFVYWVYKKNGYKIPRISADQAKTGRSISKKAAREGDILVFKVSQSPRGLHTGIYTGKNKFIHSPSKGKKVKIDSVNNVYWKNKLVAIRRVVR